MDHGIDLADIDPGRNVVLELQLSSGQRVQVNLGSLVENGGKVNLHTATTTASFDRGDSDHAEADPDDLIAAIQMAQHRGSPVSLTVGDHTPTGQPRLSTREREVLFEWFKCGSKQLAAARLHLSARTVATYLERVRNKYADVGRPAPTKAALLARAIQDGLIGPDEL